MFPLIVKLSGVDPATQEIPDEPIVYIIGSNGPHIQKKTVTFRAVVSAKTLPMLDEVKQEAEYLLPPIPPELVMQMLLFFRAIWERQKSEAILIISYNATRGTFRLDAPPQQPTAWKCPYERLLRPAEGFEFVGTVHSHGDLGAGHSSTDTDDEESFDGIHMTFGKIDRATRFEMVASLAVSGCRFPQNVERVLGGVRKLSSEAAKPLSPLPPPVQIILTEEHGRNGIGAVIPIIDQSVEETTEQVTEPVTEPAVETATEPTAASSQNKQVVEAVAESVAEKPSVATSQNGAASENFEYHKTLLESFGGMFLHPLADRIKRSVKVMVPRRLGKKDQKNYVLSGAVAPVNHGTYSWSQYEPEGYVVDLPPDCDRRECVPPAEWGEMVKQPPPPEPYVATKFARYWPDNRSRFLGGEFPDGEVDSVYVSYHHQPYSRTVIESARKLLQPISIIAAEKITSEIEAAEKNEAESVKGDETAVATESLGQVKVTCAGYGNSVETVQTYHLAGRTIAEALRYLSDIFLLPPNMYVFLNTVAVTDDQLVLKVDDHLRLFRNEYAAEMALRLKEVSLSPSLEKPVETTEKTTETPVPDATNKAAETESGVTIDETPRGVLRGEYGVLLTVGHQEKRLPNLIGMTVNEVSVLLRSKGQIYWVDARLNGDEVKTWGQTPRLMDRDHLVFYPNKQEMDAPSKCTCCRRKEEYKKGVLPTEKDFDSVYVSYTSSSGVFTREQRSFVGKTISLTMLILKDPWKLSSPCYAILNNQVVRDGTEILAKNDTLELFEARYLLDKRLSEIHNEKKKVTISSPKISSSTLGDYESEKMIGLFAGRTIKEVMDKIRTATVWSLPSGVFWGCALNGCPTIDTARVLEEGDFLELFRDATSSLLAKAEYERKAKEREEMMVGQPQETPEPKPEEWKEDECLE